ncbi:MAG TPA: hypothetical protein VHC47_00540, partial [Mucilaginibacter sp.]|nr:hypothetical protein [Mucilaginibacter sp.]
MKKLLIISLLAVSAFKSKAQEITLLKKDMYGIASDATEGRFTASAGYLKAAYYVEAQLRAAGIRSWLQPVPFRWDDYTGSKLMIKGQTFPHHAENFIVLQRGIAKAGKWVVLSPGDSVRSKPAGIILLPAADQAKDWETTVIR